MSVQIEKLENSEVKLTIEVSADKFEEALQKAYLKMKGDINIQGFRKGKAPRNMIEKLYGANIFYEEAANYAMQEAYPDAVEESGVIVMSNPGEIDVTQIEKGKSFIFTAKVGVKPEIELGDYKGLTAEKQSVEVLDEEIEKEISMAQEQNSSIAEVEDRAIKEGDIAVIDFEGFVDDVAFEGGKGDNFELTIGSHSFIDNFEDQLVGKSIGDEVDVAVTFPEQYQAEELAGKPALFKVKVNAIKEKVLPELDDEFASEVSEFDTFEEYKESVKAGIAEKKEKEAVAAFENKLVEQVVANAKFEISPLSIDAEVDHLMQDFAQRMQQNGLTMEQYMQFTGATPQTLREQMKPQAIQRISTRLVLEKIVEVENIQGTDEDVEKQLAEMATAYNMPIETVREAVGEEGVKSIKLDFAIQKAVDMIVAEAK